MAYIIPVPYLRIEAQAVLADHQRKFKTLTAEQIVNFV